jgi:hypothetical protein
MATTRSNSQEWYTYVLKLKHGKYYVGKSKDPAERSQNHWDGLGASWTKEHPPIKLERVYRNYQPYDELRYTLLMMNSYGIDNVRGANFCRVKLTDSEIAVIDSMLVGESDCCYYCGKSGHFIRTCNKFASDGILSRSNPFYDDSDDDEDDDSDDEDDDYEEEGDDSDDEDNDDDSDEEEAPHYTRKRRAIDIDSD